MFLFSSGKYPKVKLLTHMAVLFLGLSFYWGTLILFSMVAAPTYLSPNCAQAFSSHHILKNSHYFLFCFVFCFFLIKTTLWGDISLWFWFAFSWWLVMLYVFSCTFSWTTVCFLWTNVYSGPLPIFKWDCILLLLSWMSPLCIPHINPYQKYIFQIFSPIL